MTGQQSPWDRMTSVEEQNLRRHIHAHETERLRREEEERKRLEELERQRQELLASFLNAESERCQVEK